MSYAQVLRGLTSGEETNVSRKIQNDNMRLANERERSEERLKAISVRRGETRISRSWSMYVEREVFR